MRASSNMDSTCERDNNGGGDAHLGGKYVHLDDWQPRTITLRNCSNAVIDVSPNDDRDEADDGDGDGPAVETAMVL